MKVYLDANDIGKTITYKEENGVRQYLYVHDKEGFIFKDLSDYTKQVRKEVCEEIYRVLTNEDVWRGLKKWWLNNGECKELRQILDQIQGELSDRKKEEHSL